MNFTLGKELNQQFHISAMSAVFTKQTSKLLMIYTSGVKLILVLGEPKKNYYQ